MKTKILILITICINVTFTLARAQLTQEKVRKLDATLSTYDALYPEETYLIRNQAICILYPTRLEDHKEPTGDEFYYRSANSLHIKNRYTRSEFKIAIRNFLGSTIRSSDADTVALGFAWTVVVPIFTYIAKGVADMSDQAKAKAEIKNVLSDLYSNPNNICENLTNNGDLNLEDLPEY